MLPTNYNSKHTNAKSQPQFKRLVIQNTVVDGSKSFQVIIRLSSTGANFATFPTGLDHEIVTCDLAKATGLIL